MQHLLHTILIDTIMGEYIYFSSWTPQMRPKSSISTTKWDNEHPLLYGDFLSRGPKLKYSSVLRREIQYNTIQTLMTLPEESFSVATYPNWHLELVKRRFLIERGHLVS